MTSFLKKHQIIIASALLLIFSLHLALTDKKEPARGALIKDILTAMASPIEKAAGGAQNGVIGIFENYVLLLNTKTENDSLKAALIAVQAENNKLREEVNLNARLKELLAYKEDSDFSTITASVISFGTNDWAGTALINKGHAEGVKKDMAIITPLGVMGRVINAGANTSRVLLNTDPRSNIDVVVRRTRVKGVIEGNGSDALYLKYIRQLDDVQAGDEVITSGLTGIFPKGLVVGTVIKTEKGGDNFFKQIDVWPAVEMSRKLEEVLIVTDIGTVLE
ncbi:rod shape-determining protein MreC [bacterium]|nr:MAG: rod shape-determining protein MreC [bacterium]